jgi:hypothetical protein
MDPKTRANKGKKQKKKKILIWIRPPLEHGIFFSIPAFFL